MTKRMTVEGEKKGKNVLGVAPDDEPEREEEKRLETSRLQTTTQQRGMTRDVRTAYSIQLISHTKSSLLV